MNGITVLHFLFLLLLVGGSLRVFQAAFSDRGGVLGAIAQASGVIY